MTETWVTLKGKYEGCAVSNWGRFKGRSTEIIKPRVIGETSNHLRIEVLVDGHKTYPQCIKLVATAFLSFDEETQGVRPIDADPNNLRVSNIEVFNKNEEFPNKDKPTREHLLNLIRQGLTIPDIAEHLGLSKGTIDSYLTKFNLKEELLKDWRHVNALKSNVRMDEEIWVPIAEGVHQVSNYGRVRKVATGRILKVSISESTGYSVVSVSINGKGKKVRVAQLVADAFITADEKYKWIIYLDGDSLNSRADNIALSDKAKPGALRQEVTPLTLPDEVYETVKKVAEGKSFKEVEEEGGVSRHVLLNYGFPSNKKEIQSQYLTHGEDYLRGELNIQRVERLPGEEFKPINEAPNYYVSNMGRVISRVSFTREVLKTPIKNSKNLVYVALRVGSVQTNFTLKKLVAEAFLLNPREYTRIINLNRDVEDCRAENLAYVSNEQFNYLTRIDTNVQPRQYLTLQAKLAQSKLFT